MIKGIIFDMDGLMFDTETMYLDLVPALAKAHGIDIDRPNMKRIIGCDITMLDDLEADFPGIKEVITKDYQGHRMEHFFKYFPTPGSANKKGLKELVEFLNEKKIPYAIASSSAKDNIEAMCQYANIDLRPAAIISSRAGYPSKPNPAVFLAAANAMGLKPEECLVLEDSKFGLQAAKAGNFESIWIPDQLEADHEMKSYIQKQMDSLLDVRNYLMMTMETGT